MSRPHDLRVGSMNRRAKLDDAAVRDIRASSESSTVLAARHGVSRALVYKVRRGLGWGHVL